MTRLLLPGALAMAMGVAGPAYAEVIFYDPCTGSIGCTVTDAPSGTPPLYHGGGQVGGAPFMGDTVGQIADFDILRMDVERSGGNLLVSIVTRFVPDAATYPNIHYGDLLISTTGWAPSGSAPYDGDTASTSGTRWDFAIDTCTDAGTATCGIYRVDGLSGAGLLKTTDVAQDSLYRSDQYVKTDQTNPTGGLASLTVDPNYFIPDALDGSSLVMGSLLTYTVTAASLGLAELPAVIALRWTQTCANDIIEAASSVPEPGSLALFAAGGWGWRLLRRRPAEPAR
jgi:hypothetical protein